LALFRKKDQKFAKDLLLAFEYDDLLYLYKMFSHWCKLSVLS